MNWSCWPGPSPLFVFTSACIFLTLRLIVISNALSSESYIDDHALDATVLEDTRRRVYWQLLVCFPAALYFLHKKIKQRIRSPPPSPADPRYNAFNDYLSRRYPRCPLTIDLRCCSWPSPLFGFASATIVLALRLIAISTALSTESHALDATNLEDTRRRVCWQLLVCFPAALYFLRKKMRTPIDPRYGALAHYIW